MKKIIKTSLLIASASIFQIHGADIRIAVDGSFAPFAQVDENGELFGFDIDIAHALCADMKVSCRIMPQTWDGMIPGLKVGKFDAVISSMSITQERAKVVDFSERYYSNVLAFIGAKAQQFDLSNKGITGLTVGAYRATVSSQYLEDNDNGKVKIKLYDTQDLAYLDLKAGRIDLLLSDKFPAYDWLASSQQNAQFEFKGEDIDINDKIAIALKKGSALREPFNQAIKNIWQNGTYQTINNKYFPFSIY